MNKLRAKIHCQFSKYRNRIQNGVCHKIIYPDEHITDSSNGMRFYQVERTYGQTRLHAV